MMRLCALGVKSSVERDWLLCISKSFGRKLSSFAWEEIKLFYFTVKSLFDRLRVSREKLALLHVLLGKGI